MTGSRPLTQAGAVRAALTRAWFSWRTPVVPDRLTVGTPSPRELWLWRLDRVRDTLEQARAVLETQGWTSGAWFAVTTASGEPRLVSTREALALRDPRREVAGACLVGALVRLADDPDTAVSVSDVWGCVDELYEAMHEQHGHASFPPGRSYSYEQRRGHLQALTAWNDAPGRTRGQVVDLFDRAVARNMVAACS